MKFTRLKTTVMAGLMAASMLAPGMTAFADGTSVQYPTIKKTVTAASGVTLPTQDANGNDLCITFSATQYDADSTKGGKQNGDGSTQNQDITDQTLSIKVADLDSNRAGYASIQPIVDQINTNGAYTVEIQETAPADKGAAEYGWTIDTTKYYLHIIVEDPTTEKAANYNNKYMTFFVTTTNTVTDSKYDNKKGYTGEDADSRKVLFNVDNTYTKRGGSGTDPKGEDSKAASLTIAKTVSGNSAAYAGDTFEFTVTFGTSNNKVATVDANGYKYKIGDTEKTVKSGETIKLTNGQTASFSDIPAGITVAVVETANANTKTTKVTTYQNGTKVQDAAETLTATTVTIGDQTNSVAFDNEYNDITPTGVVTSIAPYITLVVVAFAAVAAYVVMKRRVAR